MRRTVSCRARIATRRLAARGPERKAGGARSRDPRRRASAHRDAARARRMGPMIRAADAEDRARIEQLLVAALLPTEGVADPRSTFFVAEKNGRIVGAAGLEPYGEYALLRSVVVAEEAKGS